MSAPTVTLFTRPGCHLCEDARAMLQELAGLYPHQLEEVNIDDDAALRARYHLTIPVISIGSIELAAPIGQRDLEAALRSASES